MNTAMIARLVLVGAGLGATASIAPALAATPHVKAEYALPNNGSLGAVVAGPDGREWVAGYAQIFGVTVGGQVTTYATASNGDSLCVGPDGALWFGAVGSGNLGRITTGGQVSTIAIPPPAGSRSIPLILGITTGPDGALWMTDYSNAELIRYVPGGQPTYIPLGSGSYPYGIVDGPDGALWVADDATKVERVTTGGAVTAFGLPGFYGSRSITVGGDGNLWVNNANGGLGRITPGGQVTAFPVRMETGQAPDIQFVASDRAGNIWFNAWYAYPLETLGVMNTAGQYRLVGVPTQGSGAYALARGPSGPNMWFSEAFASKVGVVGP